MQVALGEDKEIFYKGGPSYNLSKDRKSEMVTYSPELAEKVINQIASGKSLISVCAQDGMPDTATVLRWRNSNQEFEESYKSAIITRARIRHEEAEQEVDDLKGCKDKALAYVADVRNRNRFKLMEVGSPADYSPKLQMNHLHTGSVVSISLDLAAPQSRSDKETKIIEHNQPPSEFDPNLATSKTDIPGTISPPVEDKSKA